MPGRMEREREKGKRERSRDTRFIIGRKKERERGGNRHGRRVTNFCRVLTNRLYLARDEIRVLLRI